MALWHACVWLWKGRSSVMNCFRARPVTENLRKFKSHIMSSGWQSSVNTSVWDSSRDFRGTPWMEREPQAVCSIRVTTHCPLSHISPWTPSAQWRSPVKNTCCVLAASGSTPTARAAGRGNRSWRGQLTLLLVVRVASFWLSSLSLFPSAPSPSYIYC